MGYAHRTKIISAGTLALTEPAPEGPKVCKEPPQDEEEPMTKISMRVLRFARNHLEFIIPWHKKCSLTEKEIS